LCPLKRGAAFYDDLLSQRSFNVPLYDYLCLDCAQVSELLVTGSNEKPACAACGSRNLRKMLSAHSSLSGTRTTSFPGPGDTSCCGSGPAHAGCAGPGSCCGKGPHH